MNRRPTLRGQPVAATAAVGVVIGHWAAYLITVPDAPARAAVLASSGHGYWLYAVKAAVILGFVAIGSVVVRHLSARLRHDRPHSTSGFALWGRLAFIQALAFTAMEIAERLVAHAPVAGMFLHGMFAVGISLQVVVALLAALLLRWLSGTVERLVVRLVRSALSKPPEVLHRPPAARSSLRLSLAGAAGARGPPSVRGI